MPYKFNQPRRRHIKKSSDNTIDWGRYDRSLKQRGRIEVWLSPDAIAQWYETDRIYDGTGTPNLYSEESAKLPGAFSRRVFG